MTKRLYALFNGINRQPAAVIIFIVAMANYFSFTLSGGEEQYFAYAKQYMNPAWMPNSFSLNQPAGGNLVFQIIVGFLLKYLSFEQMAAIGRTFVFLMVAWPLGRIFRKLRISNIEILFLLQFLFFFRQAFYAGEWLFNSFEEKTMAYIFVFWALYFLLSEKPVISALFTALATYFHFLIGGWIFGFVFLYFVVRKKQVLPLIYTVFVYVLLTGPLIYYLYKTYLTGNPAIINGINTNTVYAFRMLRHHTGIFADASYFFTYPFGGIAATLFIFGICVFYFRKLNIPWLRELNTLNIIILSQQLIFIIVKAFDRNGILMRTWPFRSNSMPIFIFYMECMLFFRYYIINHLYPLLKSRYLQHIHYGRKKQILSNSLNGAMLLAVIPVFTQSLLFSIKNIDNSTVDADQDMVNLMDYAKEKTPGSSVFLLLDGDEPYSFIRRTEREQFVVKKFIPATSPAIYEWYRRSMLKERLKQDISLIDSLKQVYQINYLVSDSLYNYPALIPEKKFGKHQLYRISR